jgi:hypothetical protein
MSPLSRIRKTFFSMQFFNVVLRKGSLKSFGLHSPFFHSIMGSPGKQLRIRLFPSLQEEKVSPIIFLCVEFRSIICLTLLVAEICADTFTRS